MARANLQDAAEVAALFERATRGMAESPLRSGASVRLPARGRLLATGDLHDNPQHLRKIVHLARLDESPDHHVVLHEIVHSETLINGVDLSHRILARVAELIETHPGQVHALLGNHELAQMCGHRVSKGAGDNVELFNNGIEFVFGDDGPVVAEAINGFIRAMPLAARSDSGVFCAHSLPAPRVMDRFDPDVLERALTDEDYRSGEGSAYFMVWGRGYGESEIETLAARWGVALFCLGHERADNGLAMRGSRTVILNSDHEMGTVVPIDLAAAPTAEACAAQAILLRSIAMPEGGT